MTTRLRQYLCNYGVQHINRLNVACHFVGVPLLVFAAIGTASRWVLFNEQSVRIDGATLVGLIAVIAYACLDVKVAVVMSLAYLACYYVARELPPIALTSMWIVGILFQILGHYVFERRSPAFFKNPLQLIVGPLWVCLRFAESARSLFRAGSDSTATH